MLFFSAHLTLAFNFFVGGVFFFGLKYAIFVFVFYMHTFLFNFRKTQEVKKVKRMKEERNRRKREKKEIHNSES